MAFDMMRGYELYLLRGKPVAN